MSKAVDGPESGSVPVILDPELEVRDGNLKHQTGHDRDIAVTLADDAN